MGEDKTKEPTQDELKDQAVPESESKEQAPATSEEVKEDAPASSKEVKEDTPASSEEVHKDTLASLEQEKDSKDSKGKMPSSKDDSFKKKTTASRNNKKKTKSPDEEPARAHDDFDWDVAEIVEDYSPAEREKYAKLYESTLNIINKNEIVRGTIVAITDKDVVLNIGFKSDGLIPLSEFREDKDIKVQDEIEVFVIDEEDALGQLVLSRKNAKLIRAWEQIVTAYKEETILEGTVISKTKGGMVVNLLGFETFLPGSQIDVKPITDYDYYVGKDMEFKVVKINEAIRNAVVSHKAIIEGELESQRQGIIAKLEKGQVLEGLVKNITDFGAFINLGGVDGLLYLSDISWGRIGHPTEILELNQKINVVILDFDNEKKRISLGLKQLQPHPWDVLDEKLVEGSKVKGKVVNIEDYGAFLEIIPGVEGLVHVSEGSWALQPINPKEFFTVGEEHETIIVTMNREDRKMSLSIKQLTKDPWDDIEKKYAVDTKHKGKVVSVSHHGAFVAMEEGIGGLVHISDFSWIKKINHPKEFVNVGDEIEVIVLKLDKEDRRLSLGYKQLQEDPWDGFKAEFKVDSIHPGTVLKVDGREAVVRLPHDLTLNIPANEIKKEDGTLAAADEVLDFRIIEFDREKRRILITHKDLIKPEKTEKEEPKAEDTTETKPAEPKKERAPKKSKSFKPKSFGEKSTLGDLEVFSQLKEKMKGGGEEAEPTVETPEDKTEKPKEETTDTPVEVKDEKAVEAKTGTEDPAKDEKAAEAKTGTEDPAADEKAVEAKTGTEDPATDEKPGEKEEKPTKKPAKTTKAKATKKAAKSTAKSKKDDDKK
ncbi:MAG: 30S ribosomal protein S1 [Bacteroidetes bacterium]|nr:30S ribosomal protein S1 [Bacteroidota bacterium]